MPMSAPTMPVAADRIGSATGGGWPYIADGDDRRGDERGPVCLGDQGLADCVSVTRPSSDRA
jgi:hypothetical protein